MKKIINAIIETIITISSLIISVIGSACTFMWITNNNQIMDTKVIVVIMIVVGFYTFTKIGETFEKILSKIGYKFYKTVFLTEEA